MKIAVPASGGLIEEDFGHCREFMVFSVGFGGRLSQEPSVESSDSSGCKSSLAAELSRERVTHLVLGSIGEETLRALSSRGIAVIRGASGDARAAAEAFARGKLVDSGGGRAGRD